MPGAHAPRLATATTLPSKLVFPSKEGKEAEEASYAASRAQARPAVLRATTLQQRHSAAKAIFTSFLTKKCFPRSWQQSLRSSIILPMAISCPLPGYRAFAAQTSVSLNILFYSVKPKDVKEYLKHFTENVNAMVSRDLRSLIKPCLGITDTYLVFERRLEVSTTSSSTAGQSESTSGNLQTYSKASLTVWRLLLTLDILASVEACPVSPTSGTFSSSPQEPFTWPETFTHPHQAEKDQAPYTSAIASLQAPFIPAPKQQERTTSILGAFMGLGLGTFFRNKPRSCISATSLKNYSSKKTESIKKKIIQLLLLTYLLKITFPGVFGIYMTIS